MNRVKSSIAKMPSVTSSTLAVTLFWCCTAMAIVEEAPAEMRDLSYSPYVSQSFPDKVYWGDTHVHTNLSLDAYILGNRKLGPDEAYRFARGETVRLYNGLEEKLNRPLDFLVVADHASSMGLFPKLEVSDQVLLQTKTGRSLHARYEAIKHNFEMSDPDVRDFVLDIGLGKVAVKEEKFRQSVWQENIASAEAFNDPGKFTTFIGYEWTSEPALDPEVLRSSLHRVVIFKDGGDKAGQVLPFTRNDGQAPEELWAYMANYQQQTGGDILAIPHGANVSNGAMFATNDAYGQPFSQSYARTRSRWEPLFEVTQRKGDSETHPLLSPRDEFADYETWNSWPENLQQRGLNKTWRDWSDEEKNKKRYEYARSVLKIGLQKQFELGVNPFKFGMIGSTDVHSSLSMIDESSYILSPKFESATKRIKDFRYSAAGYAGVWATENTREALFAAMQRKETYASTGPRIAVRLFGG